MRLYFSNELINCKQISEAELFLLLKMVLPPRFLSRQQIKRYNLSYCERNVRA